MRKIKRGWGLFLLLIMVVAICGCSKQEENSGIIRFPLQLESRISEKACEDFLVEVLKENFDVQLKTDDGEEAVNRIFF